MNFSRLGASASLVALGVLLAACGGGGGGGPVSTPPPAGGGGGTPTPTPPPGTNDDLLAPLVSETFTNVASRATAAFNGSNVTGSTSSITATISYNSGNQNYTLSTPTGSISFGPGDIDNSQGSAGAVVYVKTSGNRQDSLTVTRPGTSGPLTYRYVGGAFWQSITQTSSTSLTGSIDSIVYGVETAAGNVPVSGSANYDIDLIGARTTTNDLIGLAGIGTASVDFASGDIIIVGRITIGSPFGNNGSFIGLADIDAGGTFTGTLTIEDGEFLDGQLTGRFFGPDAAEIGAAFRATGPVGMVATGAIMGRQGAPDAGNTFSTSEAILTFDFDDRLGFNEQLGDIINISTSTGPFTVRYDAANGYSLYLGSEFQQIYEPALLRFRNVPPDQQVTFGGLGMEQYLLGEEFEYVGSSAIFVNDNDFDYRLNAFVYGFETPDNAVPVSGTGTYFVRVEGYAADTQFRNPMGFSGTGDLLANFASGAITSSIPLNYGEMASLSGLFGESRTGTFEYNGLLTAGTGDFTGTVSMTGIGNYTGSGSGRFFGPTAQEFGGIFTATEGAGGSAIGVFSGVLDPARIPPPPGSLAALTAPAALAFDHGAAVIRAGEVESIGYDPADDSYSVTFTGDAIWDLDLDAATADVYNGAHRQQLGFYQFITDPSDGSFHDMYIYIHNPDANPLPIELSYMTFGIVTISPRASIAPSADDHMPFAAGLATSTMPNSGSATYSGVTSGFAHLNRTGSPSDNSRYRFTGTVDLTAQFGGGTLTAEFAGFTADVNTSDNINGVPSSLEFDAFTLNGTIVGSSFAGSANQGGWERVFEGHFYGPGAEEAGGVFQVQQGTPGVSAEAITAEGSFGAVKN